MDACLKGISIGKKVIIERLNGHIGKSNKNYELVHRSFGMMLGTKEMRIF